MSKNIWTPINMDISKTLPKQTRRIISGKITFSQWTLVGKNNMDSLDFFKLSPWVIWLRVGFHLHENPLNKCQWAKYVSANRGQTPVTCQAWSQCNNFWGLTSNTIWWGLQHHMNYKGHTYTTACTLSIFYHFKHCLLICSALSNLRLCLFYLQLHSLAPYL